MSRITGREVSELMEAYHSIYEGYGKKGKKKIMHDCATHVEHSEYGLGNCIKEMHTLDEEGNVSHYDVEFEHGIVENVPVSELNILVLVEHPHEANEMKNAEVLGEAPMTAFQAAGGNAKLAQLNRGRSPRSGRATASSIEALGQQNLYKAGGGDAAIAKGPTRVQNVRGGGTRKVPTLTRQDIINRGTVAGAKPPGGTPPGAKPPGGTPPGAKPPGGTPPGAKPPAAKSAPSAPAAKPAAPQKSFNPLMQKTFGYQTGNAPDQIAKASAGAPPTPSGSALGAAAKPEVRKALNLPVKPATPTQATAAAPSTSASASGDLSKKTAEIAKKPVQPAVAPTPTQMRQGTFREGVDAYDLVLDYLLENGHADTVDEAHYVMLEMDSKMIKSIVEGGINFSVPSRIDDFNNRRNELKNRYKQDVGPRIPGPGGGGQYGEPSAPKATGVRLARGTSSSNRGKESKNQA